MYQISRKRVNLSFEEKLWIIRKNKEHQKNSTYIDFGAKMQDWVTFSLFNKSGH